ncbi:Phosphate acetyltransferase [Budvicia aquatica]|uniref:Phosphate acetyltransferase n=1 Tax=Budvicia aquatica TaxID=82979 RepID=A0A484ZU71_9GAMM|nr:phosphate acyltransferase [Budvicia aquatica]VFS51944.1 Phosphate acetyltransferase [Budvicia aquatica]
MITSLSQLVEHIKQQQPKRIVIAGAEQEELLLANQAYSQGLATFVLIGDRHKIQEMMQKNNLSEDLFEVIDEPNQDMAARLAVKMVIEGDADIPMKGTMHTSTFLKAVLDKNHGLATNMRISQITIFDGYNKTLQFLTDCAINIKPDLKEKKSIIENAVFVAKKMGYSMPLVALIGSIETVSESMPDTLDSAVLTQMNRRKQIKDCIVDGPLSLDNAICQDAAKQKVLRAPLQARLIF